MLSLNEGSIIAIQQPLKPAPENRPPYMPSLRHYFIQFNQLGLPVSQLFMLLFPLSKFESSILNTPLSMLRLPVLHVEFRIPVFCSFTQFQAIYLYLHILTQEHHVDCFIELAVFRTRKAFKPSSGPACQLSY